MNSDQKKSPSSDAPSSTDQAQATEAPVAKQQPRELDYGALAAAALNEAVLESMRKTYLLGLSSRTPAEQAELDSLLTGGT